MLLVPDGKPQEIFLIEVDRQEQDVAVSLLEHDFLLAMISARIPGTQAQGGACRGVGPLSLAFLVAAGNHPFEAMANDGSACALVFSTEGFRRPGTTGTPCAQGVSTPSIPPFPRGRVVGQPAVLFSEWEVGGVNSSRGVLCEGLLNLSPRALAVVPDPELLQRLW